MAPRRATFTREPPVHWDSRTLTAPSQRATAGWRASVTVILSPLRDRWWRITQAFVCDDACRGDSRRVAPCRWCAGRALDYGVTGVERR